MGYDVGGHFVYGVILDTKNKKHKLLLKEFRKELERLERVRTDQESPELDTETDLNDAEAIEKALNASKTRQPKAWEWLKSNYSVPEADLFYTGNEDDRPGRCNVDADEVIFGIGVMQFPLRHDVSEAFRKDAQWYDWVEGG